MHVVILAAGMGTRLGRSLPKPLTKLSDGRTIMQQQLDNIQAVFGNDVPVNIVVGYRHELIMQAHPQHRHIVNPHYDQTNTSKSLLQALQHTPKNQSVLWMNGDVVFDVNILQNAWMYIDQEQSFAAVNTDRVAEEEVKYTVSDDGHIARLAKTVPIANALGEAVGINFISAHEKLALISALKKVDNQDYFEKGIEDAIQAGQMKVLPFDISLNRMYAVEVDFQEDLERANLVIQ